MMKNKNENDALALILVLFCDPGGILTHNRWSRNPVRYTVAPRSLFWRMVQLKSSKGKLRHGAFLVVGTKLLHFTLFLNKKTQGEQMYKCESIDANGFNN